MAAAELKTEPTLCHGLIEAIAASLRDQTDSQELAAQLGGEIQVHCRAGEGSTYVLHFPEH